MQIHSIPLADHIFFFTSCCRCRGKEKALLYIFCVRFGYTTIFFPHLFSLPSLFFKLSTESAACTCLKWEDFEVQQLCQSFFLWFLSKLILTYSVSAVHLGLRIHLYGDDDQKGKYKNFVFGQQLVLYKMKSNQPKQSCLLSNYVAVRALLQKLLIVSICKELIIVLFSCIMLLGKKKKHRVCLFIFCFVDHILPLFLVKYFSPVSCILY